MRLYDIIIVNVRINCLYIKKSAAQPPFTRVQRGVDLSGGEVYEGGLPTV